MSVKKQKPVDNGSDDDLMAAFVTIRSVFGETTNTAYVRRCQDLVAVGLCSSPTRGMTPGRYPCANEAEAGEPYCEGPCQPMTVFLNA